MKLRQAKKIMKNIRRNVRMEYISVSPKWRKATVNELIEHFKTKEE